jgi:phage terminase large subunit-like protein
VGAVSDLTPLVWVVPCPHIDGAWDVFVRVFLSEAALTNSRNADLYRSWRDARWLTVTPGKVVDYRRVTAAPMTELERLLQSGMLHHGANPILRWCMAHLVVKADHDGGLKPDKRRSHERIDGVVGLGAAEPHAVRMLAANGSTPGLS